MARTKCFLFIFDIDRSWCWHEKVDAYFVRWNNRFGDAMWLYLFLIAVRVTKKTENGFLRCSSTRFWLTMICTPYSKPPDFEKSNFSKYFVLRNRRKNMWIVFEINWPESLSEISVKHQTNRCLNWCHCNQWIRLRNSIFDTFKQTLADWSKLVCDQWISKVESCKYKWVQGQREEEKRKPIVGCQGYRFRLRLSVHGCQMCCIVQCCFSEDSQNGLTPTDCGMFTWMTDSQSIAFSDCLASIGVSWGLKWSKFPKYFTEGSHFVHALSDQTPQGQNFRLFVYASLIIHSIRIMLTTRSWLIRSGVHRKFYVNLFPVRTHKVHFYTLPWG